MILQTELTTLDTEISQLLAELEAKRQQQEVLTTAESFAGEALDRLKLALNTISDVAPGAIRSLKSAILNLFPDDGNDGGNEPNQPTPPDNLDSDEPEKDNPVCPDGEHILESNAPLIGQVCPVDFNLHWENTAPDGTAWEFASSLLCPLEDAPSESLVGQSYELASLIEDKPAPFVELVSHPDNANVCYLKKTADGQILTAYFGFTLKRNAQSWKEFLEAISHRVECRKAKQVPGASWEIKCWGMAMNQIDRLAANCDFSKPYQPQAPKAESPAQAAGIEPPAGWGEVNTIPVLEENDICEVLQGKFTGQVGTVATISQFSEKPIAVNLPGGHIKHFLRSELKFVSKGEPKPQRRRLESGQVLMGNRVVTSGNYVGVAATLRANNAARGLETKLAAAELMKAGLTPEMALATATGTELDDIEF